MNDADWEIALATRVDIPGIVELQKRNLRSNGGALSIEFSAEWFEQVLFDMPTIVARKHGRIVGYIVSSPLTATANVPISQAKLRAYPASRNAYNYGPVCVAESERGRGLAFAMFEALRARLPGREGIAFVRRDNTASLLAHTKLGMRQVAEFTHADVAYVVVVFIGDFSSWPLAVLATQQVRQLSGGRATVAISELARGFLTPKRHAGTLLGMGKSGAYWHRLPFLAPHADARRARQCER